MPSASDPSPYDALLLVSFGGPEGQDDVVPFLQNVTRGRAIPPERLEEVAAHYRRRGGVSPINAQNRALLASIRTELAATGTDLPVYWGNRNWPPMLVDAFREIAADGRRRVLALLTSAYSSYSGCRQYREDLAAARAEAGAEHVDVDRVRHYFNHPGFIGPMVDATVAALDTLDQAVRADARLVFVTHSVPVAMADAAGPDGGAYVRQHEDVARLVTAGVAAGTANVHDQDLAYCSRSGAPGTPWLEPDVNDRLRALAAEGVPSVVLVPIGFVSDHMEVVHDLDTEALETAATLGLPAARAATVGTAPDFVAAIRELVLERAALVRGGDVVRRALGELGPSHDICPAGCCPNPRGERPALCGVEVSAGASS